MHFEASNPFFRFIKTPQKFLSPDNRRQSQGLSPSWVQLEVSVVGLRLELSFSGEESIETPAGLDGVSPCGQ